MKWELPLEMQAILRVLQRRKVRPVAAILTSQIDVRVIAAPNPRHGSRLSRRHLPQGPLFPLGIVTPPISSPYILPRARPAIRHFMLVPHFSRPYAAGRQSYRLLPPREEPAHSIGHATFGNWKTASPGRHASADHHTIDVTIWPPPSRHRTAFRDSSLAHRTRPRFPHSPCAEMERMTFCGLSSKPMAREESRKLSGCGWRAANRVIDGCDDRERDGPGERSFPVRERWRANRNAEGSSSRRK